MASRLTSVSSKLHFGIRISPALNSCVIPYMYVHVYLYVFLVGLFPRVFVL